MLEATPVVLNYLSIDPGDVHQGTAYFEIDLSINDGHCLKRWWTRDLDRKSLIKVVEEADVNAIVIEAYRLYPELAREQGYSDFPTVKVIGVVEYIAELRGIEVFVQGADVKKRARRIGERGGMPGKERMLGAGRGRYRGWDFDGPSQHERDATAHGVWWAFRNKNSLLSDLDLKRECRMEVVPR